MRWSVIFLAVLFASQINAELSFKKDQNKAPAQNAAEKIDKVMTKSDLSGVNLRVEGAAFRKFSLYFPSSEQKSSGMIANKIFGELRQIIDRDLAVVGAFNFITASTQQEIAGGDAIMKQKGAEGISKLSLNLSGDTIKARIEHKNLITGKATTKNIDGKIAGARRLAHQLAQSIYEEFVGPENIFLLDIAAIKRDKSGEFHVVMMDFSGKNETLVNGGKWMKTSLSFAPNGESLLYSVNTPDGQGIVEQPVGSKQFQFRLKKPGLNIDPRVLPDNSGMLVTLSFEGNANIYRTTRLGTIIGPLTSGLGLNLSATISADGKKIAYVSDRSGTPQIYMQPLDDPNNKIAVRVTNKGNYNQTPALSSKGDLLAFTGRDDKTFDIFAMDLTTNSMWRVTQSQGANQEPDFSPSSNFIYFLSDRDSTGKQDIFISTVNGNHQYRISDAASDANSLGYTSLSIKPKP